MTEQPVVALLTRILSLWDLTGAGGYLQGMSDLAAIIFIALVGQDEQLLEELSLP